VEPRGHAPSDEPDSPVCSSNRAKQEACHRAMHALRHAQMRLILKVSSSQGLLLHIGPLAAVGLASKPTYPAIRFGTWNLAVGPSAKWLGGWGRAGLRSKQASPQDVAAGRRLARAGEPLAAVGLASKPTYPARYARPQAHYRC